MMRLAEEMDGAGLGLAAAYVSMAADSILDGGEAEAAARDEGIATGVDLDFTLDERGQAWMIREGDCHLIGPGEAVCSEMRRFLADVAAGGDGYAQPE